MNLRKNIEVLSTSSGDKVEIKKGKFGYRIVHPIKDREGKTIWVNVLVGGWSNFFRILIYIVIASVIYLGFNEVLGQCEVIVNSCNSTVIAPW